MYSLTLKFKNTGKTYESHNDVEAEMRSIAGNDVLDYFIRELAHGIAQGWVVNRSLKKVNQADFDASYTLYSKTLTNLKSLQDLLETSSNFKTLVLSLKDAGWEVSTEVGQENDEFFVYNLHTALVADTFLEN